MKINLSKMNVQASLKGPVECIDLKDAVAEAVYQNATDLFTHKLAHRIDESDGEIELNNKEAYAVKMAIRNWKYFAQMPILAVLDDTEKA